jgi:hypothetical protein
MKGISRTGTGGGGGGPLATLCPALLKQGVCIGDARNRLMLISRLHPGVELRAQEDG